VTRFRVWWRRRAPSILNVTEALGFSLQQPCEKRMKTCLGRSVWNETVLLLAPCCEIQNVGPSGCTVSFGTCSTFLPKMILQTNILNLLIKFIFIFCYKKTLSITVAARSKAWIVFVCWNTAIVGSNPTSDVDVCVRLFRVSAVLCAGSGLATGWSRARSPTDCVKDEETGKAAKVQQRTVQP
jgi:hypothetical protein